MAETRASVLRYVRKSYPKATAQWRTVPKPYCSVGLVVFASVFPMFKVLGSGPTWDECLAHFKKYYEKKEGSR
jgi:hypothetical protein